jgi:uncharacterized PurR-regulated membrane protein YhhQ (DUF165 family)
MAGKFIYLFQGTLEEIIKEISDKNEARKVVNAHFGPYLLHTISNKGKEVGFYEVAIFQHYE